MKELVVAEKNQRYEYIDFLRIIATFAVIVLHTSIQNWGCEVQSFEWNVFNFYDSVTRWCVPIFVMISGALFLGKEIEIKTLYTKKIMRIIYAFVFLVCDLCDKELFP